MEGLREWEGKCRAGLEAGLIASGLLVCAVLGSLGVGVMAAQAICVGMFRVFRIHARQVAAAQELKARELTVPAQARLDVVGN